MSEWRFSSAVAVQIRRVPTFFVLACVLVLLVLPFCFSAFLLLLSLTIAIYFRFVWALLLFSDEFDVLSLLFMVV